MLSGHREVLPQPVQKRETLGGKAGPPERRGWYAPSRDCTVFRRNYWIEEDSRNQEILFPYLSGEDLNSRPDQSPSRWVINFGNMSLDQAKTYPACLEIVERLVKPYRKTVKQSSARANWWIHERTRPELYASIAERDRIVGLSLINNHLGFAFLPTCWVYTHKVAIFPFDKHYQWAILQSSLHYHWAWHYSSTNLALLNYSPF